MSFAWIPPVKIGRKKGKKSYFFDFECIFFAIWGSLDKNAILLTQNLSYINTPNSLFFGTFHFFFFQQNWQTSYFYKFLDVYTSSLFVLLIFVDNQWIHGEIICQSWTLQTLFSHLSHSALLSVFIHLIQYDISIPINFISFNPYFLTSPIFIQITCREY